MPTKMLYTYEDAIDHLVDVFDLDRSGRSLRQCKRAVQDSNRDFCEWQDWNYYKMAHVINVPAAQSSSTITYDHTGGSNEREITLASGTWPSWAKFGEIIISGISYRIDSRVSDTVLTLEPDMNPGADVAAGTSYTLYRSRFPMPLDFRKGGPLLELTTDYALDFINADRAHHWLVEQDTPSTPWEYSFIADPKYLGTMSLQISPPSSSARTFGMMYRRRPRDLRIDTYTTGTVTIDGSPTATTTVTGGSTVWTSSHIGCVLRVSSSQSVGPTSIAGAQPADYERIVTAVGSTTSLTVDSAIDADYSAVKYSLGDPLDIEHGAMLTAFWRLLEWNFAKLTDRKDTNERESRFYRELDLARDADRRSMQIQHTNAGEEEYQSAWGTVDVTPS